MLISSKQHILRNFPHMHIEENHNDLNGDAHQRGPILDTQTRYSFWYNRWSMELLGWLCIFMQEKYNLVLGSTTQIRRMELWDASTIFFWLQESHRTKDMHDDQYRSSQAETRITRRKAQKGIILIGRRMIHSFSSQCSISVVDAFYKCCTNVVDVFYKYEPSWMRIYVF